jgi:hypothetical protein
MVLVRESCGDVALAPGRAAAMYRRARFGAVYNDSTKKFTGY